MKKNKFIPIITFILGIVISGACMYIASAISSEEIIYDNTNSGLRATKLQDAIDELHNEATTRINDLQSTINSLQNQVIVAQNECPNGKICTNIPNFSGGSITSGGYIPSGSIFVFTGELKSVNGRWTGVYEDGILTKCYQGSDSGSLCTTISDGGNANACRAGFSTECCTGSTSTYYNYYHTSTSTCGRYGSAPGGGLPSII